MRKYENNFIERCSWRRGKVGRKRSEGRIWPQLFDNQRAGYYGHEESLERGANKKEREKQNKAVRENLFEKSLDSLKESNLIAEKKANEKGHLFDGVDAREIAEIIKEDLKIEIPPEYIKLEKPIKEIGKHEIAVQKGEREINFQLEIKSLGNSVSKKRLNADKR